MTAFSGELGFTYSEAAPYLSELGHPHRLEIFSYLVRAGEKGAPVGEIQSHLGIPKSTFSHHLRQLTSVGLVTQSREGRVIRCRVDESRVKLVKRFVNECCDGMAPLGGRPKRR